MIEAFDALKEALRVLKKNKPDDRSNIDRAWAVSITMLEQVIAYFGAYVAMRLP